MARTNQGGSIVSFVVIGALLILGSAGLLYWVSHRSSPVVQTPEVTIPSDPGDKESKSNDDKTPTPSSSSEDKNTANESDDPGLATDGAVDQIPQTGPADTFLQLLMIGILTAAITIYIRSRHHRRTL